MLALSHEKAGRTVAFLSPVLPTICLLLFSWRRAALPQTLPGQDRDIQISVSPHALLSGVVYCTSHCRQEERALYPLGSKILHTLLSEYKGKRHRHPRQNVSILHLCLVPFMCLVKELFCLCLPEIHSLNWKTIISVSHHFHRHGTISSSWERREKNFFSCLLFPQDCFWHVPFSQNIGIVHCCGSTLWFFRVELEYIITHLAGHVSQAVWNL